MNDWGLFTECVPWFLDRGAAVVISSARTGYALSPVAADLFPPLAKLLAKASVTDVSVNGVHYQLLAWNSPDADRIGWLCLPPPENVVCNPHEDHRLLLGSFGGIVERFNEPEDTWLLNLNDALTQREASHDGSFIHQYRWAFDEVELELPIEPTEYYSIAREANGNTTLCHQINGDVLMFARDHCFDHLKPLNGCPEYTLYTMNGVSTFRDWVNAIALQWLAHTERST